MATKSPYDDDGIPTGDSDYHVRLAEQAFIRAAEANKVDKMVAILVRFGDRLDEYSKDRALYSAAGTGQLETVDFLLDNKISNVDTLSSSGDSPLHAAATQDNVKILERILEKSRLGVNYKDTKGQTALWHAIINRHFEVARFLVENGAEVDIVINTKGFIKGSILHLAAAESPKMLQLVLGSNRDIGMVNYQNIYGETALHVAAKSWGIGTERVHMMLELKPDLELKCEEGKTALNVAAQLGLVQRCRVLLRAGADPNTNANGVPVLSAAISKGREGVVELLLKYKADPNAKDTSGHSPLVKAVSYGSRRMVAALLRRGVDANQNYGGKTVLQHACGSSGQAVNVGVVQALLKHGADWTVTQLCGHTALHYAARGGSASAVLLLLICGANRQVRSSHNETPLDMALQYHHEDSDVVKVLRMPWFG